MFHYDGDDIDSRDKNIHKTLYGAVQVLHKLYEGVVILIVYHIVRLNK